MGMVPLQAPLYTITSHNIHDNFHCQQFGGTFILGSSPITSSIMSSGVDLSVWADGPGSTSKATLAAAFVSSLDTAPGKQRKPDCRWCTPNINSTWSPWVTTPAPALPSSGPSQLPSLFGKPLGTPSFSWQMSMAISRSQPVLPSARPTPSKRLLSLCTHLPTLATFKQGSYHGVYPTDGIWVSQDLPVVLSS